MAKRSQAIKGADPIFPATETEESALRVEAERVSDMIEEELLLTDPVAAEKLAIHRLEKGELPLNPDDEDDEDDFE